MTGYLKYLLLLLTGAFLGLLIAAFLRVSDEEFDLTLLMIEQAENLIGLEFTEAQRDSMLADISSNLTNYENIRQFSLDNSVPPAMSFSPLVTGYQPDPADDPNEWKIPGDIELPDDKDDLAWYSIPELASLIKQGKITSEELTRLYLDRLRNYDSELKAVITFTEDRALEKAREADEALERGDYFGPLHGIPYGIKDLFALEGYPTTWGATPYKDQERDHTATVVEKLDDAGAILVAKLSTGALAWGDVWYGGKTRNPWNTDQGSSGSSAGSAAATAAGLVPFTIGTETLGSIVSPASINGVTGLRPTYGRISKYGVMALSWSMDKVGPITRSVEDAAIVFDAIKGHDEKDYTSVDFPFHFDYRDDLEGVRIGYLENAFETEYDNQRQDSLVLNQLEDLGAELVPFSFPEVPAASLSFILSAEAAASFDELTRSGEDSLMVPQERNAWPNVFRASRFIPAVEYIQANRIRTELLRKLNDIVDEFDLYVSPAFAGGNLLTTNLTGHPSVVVPNGKNDDGLPVSITFTGNLFDEGELMSAVAAWQRNTDFHKNHPEGF